MNIFISTLEEQKTKIILDKESTIHSVKSNNDMKNLATEIDNNMKDLEIRLRSSFNKGLEMDAIRNTSFERKIESKIDNIHKDLVSRIESIESYNLRHNTFTDLPNNNTIDENRLSEIEAKIRYKADIKDMSKINDKIEEMNENFNISIKEITDIA
jgi:hypothetical protein